MKAVSMVAALVVVVVMVTGPLRGGGGVAEAVSCEPDCTGTDNLDKVVNPRNCTEYYLCMDGTPTDHAVACAEGYVFDTETGECIEATECVNLCSGSSGCHLTCNGTLDFISDINNCSRYYGCSPGGTVPFNCNEGNNLYFDGMVCGNDESACCKSVCEPYCDASSSGFLIPDPNDCKRYYYCDGVAEGTPGEDVHFTCSGNSNFNVQTGKCSSTAECTLLCKEGTTTAAAAGTTTTTTTTAAGTTTQGTGDGGSTSTTTPPLVTTECSASLTCTSVGYFPVCRSCQPEYFICQTVGEQATISSCTGGLVFNPVPGSPMCILEANCPYTPSRKT